MTIVLPFKRTNQTNQSILNGNFLFFFLSFLYFILRRKEKIDAAKKASEEATAAKQSDLGETTHM